MFYSEQLQSPINSYNVKRLYGVNPDNDPERAAKIGIYPLTEAPEGYDVSHYEKEGERFIARPEAISRLEQLKLDLVNQADLSLDELRTTLNLPEE